MSSQIPKSYKAQVQKEAGKPFEFVDVQYKAPEAGQIVIKVAA